MSFFKKLIGSVPIKKTPAQKKYDQKQAIDILARTLWGEARGEGDRGMEAVACIIMNRLKISESNKGFWWGGTLIEICQKPYQFSCWNLNDPNREKLLAVTEKDIYFATAKRIAQRAILGALKDKTDGATHYHAAGISPYWMRKLKPTATIGNHIFYRSV